MKKKRKKDHGHKRMVSNSLHPVWKHRRDAIFDTLACSAVFVCLFKMLCVLKKTKRIGFERRCLYPWAVCEDCCQEPWLSLMPTLQEMPRSVPHYSQRQWQTELTLKLQTTLESCMAAMLGPAFHSSFRLKVCAWQKWLSCESDPWILRCVWTFHDHHHQVLWGFFHSCLFSFSLFFRRLHF